MATVAQKLGYASIPEANHMVGVMLTHQPMRKPVSRRESGYIMPNGARVRAISRALRLPPAQARLLNV